MKNIEKVIKDRCFKIELNGLEVLDYKSDFEVLCKCKKCNHQICDNHRNLSYKNFKCKYCELSLTSDLVKNGEVKIKKIKGAYIDLECKSGHIYTQDRRNLLAGKRCKQCYLDNKVFSKDKIIEDIKNIHGDYYNYDFDGFKNIHSKIEIECKKGHFFRQKISNHLQGKGCPICRESIGERRIANYLEEYKIEYIRQKKFDGCKYISKLPFDFFIPSINLAIEYDGIQHFKPVKLFGGEKEFEKTKIKDKIKSKYCEDNNICLIRISYLDDIKYKLSNINELVAL
jgi:hypothetical protein